jgi:hypothetical protein
MSFLDRACPSWARRPGDGDLPRPPPRRDSTRVGGRTASPFGRVLSPRLVPGSRDHLPDLSVEAGTGVAALPLVETHLEELLRVWPERFAKAHGPLRHRVERVLRGFLTCGIVSRGFARLWCPTISIRPRVPKMLMRWRCVFCYAAPLIAHDKLSDPGARSDRVLA